MFKRIIRRILYLGLDSGVFTMLAKTSTTIGKIKVAGGCVLVDLTAEAFLTLKSVSPSYFRHAERFTKKVIGLNFDLPISVYSHNVLLPKRIEDRDSMWLASYIYYRSVLTRIVRRGIPILGRNGYRSFLIAAKKQLVLMKKLDCRSDDIKGVEDYVIELKDKISKTAE